MLPHQKLEKSFSEFVEVGDTVAVNTGTASLHLAIQGKHYPLGSEIIVPEFSMIATAWAPFYCGHKCVFVDCDDTLNVDESLVEKLITDKTKAIMVTHVYGRVARIGKIYSLCRKYGLDLIEDCAEAHGATYVDGPLKGCHVGSLDIGCFSFYQNKIIHGQEGGAVTIKDNPEYANHLRDLRSMSFGERHNYLHEHVGFNYRMSSAQAEMILDSLSEVKESLIKRKEIESLYDKHLNSKFIKSKRDVVWVYDIFCESPDKLVDYLNSKGISARRVFAPMSMQPCFDLNVEISNLVSYNAYGTQCYLPVNTTMTEDDVKNICEEVNNNAI